MRITMRVATIAISLISLLFLSVTAFATELPTITIGSASGKPGETVSIPVSIENNSGIVALYCSIDYDDTQLKLVKVTNSSVLTDPAHSGSLTTNPYRLCFDMSIASKNNINNGVIATLDFEILSSAKSGDTILAISYNPEEIYDYNLENVHFDILSGKVSVDSKDMEPSNPSEPPNEPTAPDDEAIRIDIEPEDNLPWDKIEITVPEGKDITTEKAEGGIIIKGDNLSDVKIVVTKNGKKAKIVLDTDKNSVMIQENVDGSVIINEGETVFPWLEMCIGVFVLMIGAVISFVLIKKRHKKE